MKNHQTLMLIILGLVFSCTVGFYYSLSPSFEFKGTWIALPFQFVTQRGASPSLVLTSHIIGYLFYLLAGVAFIKQKDLSISNNVKKVLFFFLLIASVLASEFYSIYQQLSDQYAGRFYGIGFTVFLLGVYINYRMKPIKIDQSA